MSKYLILGHNGFVGSSFVTYLGDNAVIDEKRHDLEDPSEAKAALASPSEDYDTVIMCAGSVGGIAFQQNHADMYHSNLMMGINVVNACAEAGKDLIYLGSSCMYDSSYEMISDNIMEGSVPESNYGYGNAKREVWRYMRMLYKQEENTDHLRVRATMIVPPNLFGYKQNYDNQKSHVVAAMIKKIAIAKAVNDLEIEIWGNGEQRREIMFVDQFIEHMFGHPDLFRYGTFPLNIGTNFSMSIKEIADIIKEQLGWTGWYRMNTSKPVGPVDKKMVTERSSLDFIQHDTKIYLARVAQSYYDERFK